MSQAALIMLMVAVLAFAIALGVLADRATRRRVGALAAWSAGRSWSFSTEHDGSLEERYPEFDCLRQGDDRYAYNVMEGSVAGTSHGISADGPHGPDRAGRAGADVSAGHRACAFDYHYETHSTDSKGNRHTHHHHFSAVVLECRLPLQPLQLRPETFFDRVGEFFGFDDIDFESVEFSRAFHVKARDRRWAFDAIQQSTMEFLLKSPRFCLQLDHGRIAAWRDTAFAPADFEAALGVCTGLLDRLPGYLHREWKGAE